MYMIVVFDESAASLRARVKQAQGGHVGASETKMSPARERSATNDSDDRVRGVKRAIVTPGMS